jgi:hypothetical protein
MTKRIQAGSILIASGTPLPQSGIIESEPYLQGWELVKNPDGKGLNQIIATAGWNFFYIASELKTRVFGSDEEKTSRQAIGKIIAKMTSKNFNCLEITGMTRKQFMGLPYLSVSAHSRHIQKSAVLFEEQSIASATEVPVTA